ncbi:MAG: hypothetical protein FWG21_03805, partial [Oscillospiraceae bacterium]|nr:hypothetical protein [Oscillospiraceae bacterium]
MRYKLKKYEGHKTYTAVHSKLAVLVLSVLLTGLMLLTPASSFFSDIYAENNEIVTAEASLIEDIHIFVTTPMAGIAPDLIAVEGDNTYSASSVSWSPLDNLFLFNVHYSASVTLTAASGYEFAEVFTSATINGYTAIVTDNSGAQVTLTYEFTALAAEVTNFTAETAFCTAANNKTPGNTYYVAAPADVATTFTLNTSTTTLAAGGATVTNVDTTPGISFIYTNSNNTLSSVSSSNKVVIEIPANFIGDVAVTVFAETDITKNVSFTLIIRSVEDTIANTYIPSVTPWVAGLHNAVFVAGDWEWRVLDKN